MRRFLVRILSSRRPRESSRRGAIAGWRRLTLPRLRCRAGSATIDDLEINLQFIPFGMDAADPELPYSELPTTPHLIPGRAGTGCSGGRRPGQAALLALPEPEEPRPGGPARSPRRGEARFKGGQAGTVVAGSGQLHAGSRQIKTSAAPRRRAPAKLAPPFETGSHFLSSGEALLKR